MNIKRLTKDALLAGLALIIFIVELQIPPLTPIPGIKPGLANIVTVYAVFMLKPIDAWLILLVRILLGGMFSGQMTALMYSLAGGVLCMLAMLAVRRVLSNKQIWAASAVGACVHNIGQIGVAAAVTGTWAIAAYLPVLILSGLIAGLFTGLCAQFTVNRANKSSE